MIMNFRKLNIGFLSLTSPSTPGADKAVHISEQIRAYMQNELEVELVTFPRFITNRGEARKAWLKLKTQHVDAVILFSGTFSTGELTAEIIRNLDAPYALWGLGELALDTKDLTGSMVAVVVAGAIFKNFDKQFSFIYDSIDNPETKAKLHIFVSTVRAISYLREASIAVIGMRPDGYQVCTTDELAMKKLFGTELVNISTHTFNKLMQDINEREVDADAELQKTIFDIQPKDLASIKKISRMYLALKKLVREKNIQAYAPECWPEFRDVDEIPFCLSNSRMTSAGIMAACECDVDGALSMLLGYALTGKSIFFADFANFIEDKDALLFWHCGNAPYDLAASKPVCQKVFGGIAAVSALKSGVVTIFRLHSIQGKFVLHAASGDAIEGKPLLKGSNVLVKMRGGNKKFVESMLENGIPHHNAIVYKDITKELREFAKLMNIPIVICS